MKTRKATPGDRSFLFISFELLRLSSLGSLVKTAQKGISPYLVSLAGHRRYFLRQSKVLEFHNKTVKKTMQRRLAGYRLVFSL